MSCARRSRPSKGSLQMLDSGLFGEVNSEQQELLTMAVNNSDRLSHLVNDILDLERLDAGRMPLASAAGQRLRACRAGGLRHHGSGRRGRHQRDGAGGAARSRPPSSTSMRTASCRCSRTSWAMRSKLSERGSAVRTEVTTEGDMVRICVIDEGRGIPADQLARVFERFGQVESGDARRHDGSGLGLAIAREIAVRSGGTIKVTSEVGVGSRFAVLLPSVRAGGVA